MRVNRKTVITKKIYIQTNKSHYIGKSSLCKTYDENISITKIATQIYPMKLQNCYYVKYVTKIYQ